MEEFKNDLAQLIKQATDEGADATEVAKALREAADELHNDSETEQDDAG